MPKTPFQTAGHFSTLLNASSALILAMNFDTFITLFYLMVTNALVHLFALWYPTTLYTKLHNGSDPPCTQKYLVVLEGLITSCSSIGIAYTNCYNLYLYIAMVSTRQPCFVKLKREQTLMSWVQQ